MPTKTLPYISFPAFNNNKVEIDGFPIFQFAPALEAKNDAYIYKEDTFTIPSVKVMGGIVDSNNHHWLIFITDESFLKLASVVIYTDGKKDDDAIKSITEEFQKYCIVALLVDLIPSWKELSRILHEEKIFIKASNKKIPLSTSISTKSESIEYGSKLFKAVIKKALEKNYPDLIRSLPRLKEVYDDEDINPLLKELNILEGVSISPRITTPFFGKQIDFIFSADQLEQIPEETIVEGQPFDTGNFIPECFPYEGEFPSVIPKFTATAIPQKKSSGNWSGGGTTVEYYKSEKGIKDFINFMTDEQLRLLLKDFTEESIARICLGLAGIPSSIGKLETKNTKSNAEPLTSFFEAKSENSQNGEDNHTETLGEDTHQPSEENKKRNAKAK